MSVLIERTMREFLQSFRWMQSAICVTQPRDYVESFYGQTFDGLRICVQVYQNQEAKKWFVIRIGDCIGYTKFPYRAFFIIDNCSVFTSGELIRTIKSQSTGRRGE